MFICEGGREGEEENREALREPRRVHQVDKVTCQLLVDNEAKIFTRFGGLMRLCS